jgi:hypothetical protein
VLAGSGSANNTCKPGCVSLDFLAGLAGLQDNCICLTNTLNDLQQGLGTTCQVRASCCVLLDALPLFAFSSETACVWG